MPQRHERSLGWEALFLASLLTEGTIAAAAREAGIAYRTVMRKRQKDPAFAEQMRVAQEMHTQALEREMYRRAVEGIEEPIMFRGEVVEKVRRYSDQLLMFALRARRPDVYRESANNVNVAVDGRVQFSQPITVVPDADRRAEVAKILQDALGEERKNDVTLLPAPAELPAPEK